MAKRDDITRIKKSDLKLVHKRPLGEGGFGSVYHMHLSKGFLRRPVDVAAKKVLRRDIGLHELEMLSALDDHPNIVKLIGVVDEDIEFMLILELCEGGSLRSYLDKGRRLTLKQFYAWLMQAALPLEFLKQKKITHKDVKSPNYLITVDDTLKLCDFGLAKNIERTMSNASETASHPWMAPELLKDGKLSPKYDIFALGVVIWELWTGKFPHKGLEWQVIVMTVCNRDERLPIPEDCPGSIKKLMEGCWKTDWNQRPNIEEVISVITLQTPATKEQIMSYPWKLENVFGDKEGPGKLYQARAIAVNPDNGDIAILAETRVNVYNDCEEFKFSMDTQGLKPGQTSHPCQVAVDSHNNYMVTCPSRHLNIYGINGQFKDQWQLFPSSLCHVHGLAIDCDGHVLVGDINSNQINRHEQDGTYMDSIKVSIKPRYLAVTSQDTIVVAGWTTPPQIVSNTGQVMHTLRHPVDDFQWYTLGVCCYGDMILFADRYTHHVLCYSESGEYLGIIQISSDVDLWPRDIAMTSNGKKLMVCEYGRVMVFSL